MLDEVVTKIIANHEAMSKAIAKDDLNKMSELSVRLASLNTTLALELTKLRDEYGKHEANYLLEQQRIFKEARGEQHSPSAAKNIAKEETRVLQSYMVQAKTELDKVSILHESIVSQLSAVKNRLSYRQENS